MNTPINSILEKMKPIALDEMKNIRLMDRIDSKFVAPVVLLPALLEKMVPCFKVQTSNNTRIFPYATQYLDTPDLTMFVMHQNGKLNRQKIRIRSYVDSALSFLEIKNKNNKGRTGKTRVPVRLSHLASIDELKDEKQFLGENSIFDLDTLEPVLINRFDRITLVNDRATERITIDINLSFLNCKTGEKRTVDSIMILELKQEGRGTSHLKAILSDLDIRPTSFSKYCMGIVLTHSGIKYNRFKKKWNMINKLINKPHDSN